MAVTTSGWTYALSTDPLINWPAQSAAVATKLEQRLPGGSGAGFLPFAIRTGEQSVGANGSATITFPSGRFTVAPMIIASFESTSTTLSGPCSATVSSVTAGNVYNSSNATRMIQYIAIQTTSSNARG
jgi:hypothetical protein